MFVIVDHLLSPIIADDGPVSEGNIALVDFHVLRRRHVHECGRPVGEIRHNLGRNSNQLTLSESNALRSQSCQRGRWPLPPHRTSITQARESTRNQTTRNQRRARYCMRCIKRRHVHRSLPPNSPRPPGWDTGNTLLSQFLDRK
jgi:hypothetical protein